MSRPRPFPKPIVKGQYQALVLNDEQKDWLRQYFPTVKGTILRQMMGVSLTTFYRFVREVGTKKTDAVRARIYRACSKKGKETCEKNGYYDSLKGKPLSPQCREAAKRYIQEVKEGKRLSSIMVMKKQHPKLYAKLSEEMGKKRKMLFKMEKLRVMSGMKRETKLRMAINPYTRSQTSHRHNALKRGYWVYEDCSEQGGERYNIYYDKNTERSEKFEANLKADGFNVLDGTNL